VDAHVQINAISVIIIYHKLIQNGSKLNVRTEMIKLLQENTEEKLYDLEQGKDLLATTLKASSIGEKFGNR
jgi:hypothetical protein